MQYRNKAFFHRRDKGIFWVFCALCVALGIQPVDARDSNRTVEQGIAIEFSAAPAGTKKKSAKRLIEGRNAAIQFKISDAKTGEPLKGLRPAVWLDLRKKDNPVACKDKIKSFVQGSLAYRPEIDLSAYYVVTLNDKASLSVIDPVMSFGQSKLVTRVLLPGPGEDWALSSNQRKLFVTIPKTGQLAVVDTSAWKIAKLLSVGQKPSRTALQPDEGYLWIANDEDADGGITVVNTAKLDIAARIRTGGGPHEFAFTDDSRYAFVTNQQEGSVSVIDVAKLEKVGELKTGPGPVALAFSGLSQSVYVLSEDEGTISVLDAGSKPKIVASVTAKPGIKALRFTPDGRWGLITNIRENSVSILDAATNRIVDTVQVDQQPDQITLTKTYAYIRSSGSEKVSLIGLSSLGQNKPLAVAEFRAGSVSPGSSSNLGAVASIVPAPEGNAVLVANPPEKIVYYYAEGMAAPMGSYQNYGLEPRGVLVVDRGLQEAHPGVYRSALSFPHQGTYDVAFFLDSPRIATCFTAAVEPDPLRKRRDAERVKVEYLTQGSIINVGEPTEIRFKLTGGGDRRSKLRGSDVRLLTVLAPGVWQTQEIAHPSPNGGYRAVFTPPRRGTYYVFVESPALGLRYQDSPLLALHAKEKPLAEASPEGKSP